MNTFSGAFSYDFGIVFPTLFSGPKGQELIPALVDTGMMKSVLLDQHVASLGLPRIPNKNETLADATGHIEDIFFHRAQAAWFQGPPGQAKTNRFGIFLDVQPIPNFTSSDGGAVPFGAILGRNFIFPGVLEIQPDVKGFEGHWTFTVE